MHKPGHGIQHPCVGNPHFTIRYSLNLKRKNSVDDDCFSCFDLGSRGSFAAIAAKRNFELQCGGSGLSDFQSIPVHTSPEVSPAYPRTEYRARYLR